LIFNLQVYNSNLHRATKIQKYIRITHIRSVIRDTYKLKFEVVKSTRMSSIAITQIHIETCHYRLHRGTIIVGESVRIPTMSYALSPSTRTCGLNRSELRLGMKAFRIGPGLLY